MALASDDLFRLALLEAWKWRCAWCKRPLFFSKLEVDHLIPKTLTPLELAAAVEAFGLDGSYELEAAANLLPSCRDCNGSKSDLVLGAAPIVLVLLDKAKKRGAAAEEQAGRFRADRETERAVVALKAISATDEIDEGTLRRLREIAAMLEPLLHPEPEGKGAMVRLHPALANLWDPLRWHVVRELGPAVFVVSDGHVTANTGYDVSYACSRCGSHGPWVGVICQTCGVRDYAD